MKLRRLIGPGAAIVFKGSGFYQTDYRSDSYRKAAAADGGGNGAASGSGNGKASVEKKSTTKPAAGGKGE
jgi:predicted nucleic acid-binding Zn ribbon protein